MEIDLSDKSTFTHNSDTYKVIDLLQFVKNKPVYNQEIEYIKWILNETEIESDRPRQPNLNDPIVVLDTCVKNKRRYIVIDGLHRLQLAISKHNTTIKAVMITNEELYSLPHTVDKRNTYSTESIVEVKKPGYLDLA